MNPINSAPSNNKKTGVTLKKALPLWRKGVRKNLVTYHTRFSNNSYHFINSNIRAEQIRNFSDTYVLLCKSQKLTF